MTRALLISLFLLLAASAVRAVDQAPTAIDAPKKLAPDERKRRFEALKKELEAFKPGPDAEREETLGYLEQVLNSSTKFAKENPQTPEGFEAAASGALLLAGKGHPKSGDLAQLALDVAPTAGIDLRQIAVCWLLVGNSKASAGDFAAARAAIDKMKDLAPELHASAIKQLDEFEKRAKAGKQ
ncbi:MAG TPA: hypothetical protein VKX17_00195 [Planctomycetota bacterium]|nr:hypothetical protein [Planctomycetota bacterium]